jgi:hypothetical protein
MLHRVGPVKADVSEQRVASIFRVERISESGGALLQLANGNALSYAWQGTITVFTVMWRYCGRCTGYIPYCSQECHDNASIAVSFPKFLPHSAV